MAHILLRCMALGWVLLCVVPQLCLGEAGTVKTGIGVFDTLFIAESGTLRIHGDVYLAQAHVLGKGRMVIGGDSRSEIVSDHSEISNLEIYTHTTITLEGELAVNQTLTVQSGIFDISAGKLDVADITAIALMNGGKILQNASVTSLPLQGSHSHETEVSGKAMLISIQKGDKEFSGHLFQCYAEVPPYFLVVDRDVASVPPERIKSVSVFL
jgi:hypothetical protein